ASRMTTPVPQGAPRRAGPAGGLRPAPPAPHPRGGAGGGGGPPPAGSPPRESPPPRQVTRAGGRPPPARCPALAPNPPAPPGRCRAQLTSHFGSAGATWQSAEPAEPVVVAP